MSENFEPITTQEDLDRIIGDRLARERAKYADYEELKAAADKYKDYDQVKADLEKTKGSLTALQSQYSALDEKSKEKDTKITSYEAEIRKTNVAVSKKLPLEMRKYLQGSTEEELSKSADELMKFYNTQNGGDPNAHLGSGGEDYSSTGIVNTARAMKKFEASLKSINE